MFYERYMSFFARADRVVLTDRESDVLCWSAEGKKDAEIAEILKVTSHAVRFHWRNIFAKLDAQNKVQATVMAIRRKLIAPERVRPR